MTQLANIIRVINDYSTSIETQLELLGDLERLALEEGVTIFICSGTYVFRFQ
jgi:hypothetical protein